MTALFFAVGVLIDHLVSASGSKFSDTSDGCWGTSDSARESSDGSDTLLPTRDHTAGKSSPHTSLSGKPRSAEKVSGVSVE